MPRAFRSTNHLHFGEAVAALRKDIVRRCGFEIQTVKECRILSSELEEFDRRFPLAVSTIRRFFGLIPNESEFSITTLNALARYADKPDFHFYLETVHADQFDVKTSAWDVAIPEVHIALPDSLSTLVDLVESVPYARPKTPLIARLAQGVEALYASEAAPELLWRRLNRSKRGRSLTIEGFPPLDALNGVGRAMLEDYLACASVERDRVFASTLLATGALYAGDLRTAGKVAARPPVDPDALHPVVLGRWMGLRLLLQESSLGAEAFEGACQAALAKVDVAGPNGEHTLVQPLSRLGVLCGCETLHAGLLDAVEHLARRPELAVEAAPFLGALRLEWAWLLFCNGKAPAAWRLLSDLHADGFPFFERKTSELYLHTLAAAIAPKEADRNHHAARGEAVAEALNYPWLQRRLQERIEACA